MNFRFCLFLTVFYFRLFLLYCEEFIFGGLENYNNAINSKIKRFVFIKDKLLNLNLIGLICYCRIYYFKIFKDVSPIMFCTITVNIKNYVMDGKMDY